MIPGLKIFYLDFTVGGGGRGGRLSSHLKFFSAFFNIIYAVAYAVTYDFLILLGIRLSNHVSTLTKSLNMVFKTFLKT